MRRLVVEEPSSIRLPDEGTRRPRNVHLYLMQNAHGLIKVGRSDDPAKRRIRLERQLRCQITVLKVLQNRGEDEESFHIRLRRFRLIGEWFNGTDRAREVVGALFRLRPAFVWPFAFNRSAAREWIYETADLFDHRYWERLRRRVIDALRKALNSPSLDDEGCASLDGLIAMALDREANQRGYRIEREADGRPVAVNPFNFNDRIPHYTTDLAVASALLDPDGLVDLPQGQVSARQTIAYCIEALSRAWGFGTRKPVAYSQKIWLQAPPPMRPHASRNESPFHSTCAPASKRVDEFVETKQREGQRRVN